MDYGDEVLKSSHYPSHKIHGTGIPTFPETNSQFAPENRPGPKRKGVSSSNQPSGFLGLCCGNFRGKNSQVFFFPGFISNQQF